MAVPGLFKYLGERVPSMKDSLEKALKDAGVDKTGRGADGSISGANQKMEEIYKNLPDAKTAPYNRPKPRVHTIVSPSH
jgi:hypothetical protein